MKYSDEYRDPGVARRLVDAITQAAKKRFSVMEFCGGHTHAIMRFGIRQALSSHVDLLSGPGCPVCVTANADIDAAIALAERPGITVATFGDMVRVPGSRSSLQEARSRGADVQVVYSALDAVNMAAADGDRSMVMLGIGFETTAPTIAASVKQAQAMGLCNYYVYSMHKLTPPAMKAILGAGEIKVDAVLGPGHVTSITGWKAWDFLPRAHGIPCAVSGFEPTDILSAILAIAESLNEPAAQRRVSNTYARGVTAEGNSVAKRLMADVFEMAPALWRGLGELPGSGLDLGPEYAAYDAKRVFEIGDLETTTADARGCRCSQVLRGLIAPPECPLFRHGCNPAHPIGPCMVSGEGACSAYYRYGGALD